MEENENKKSPKGKAALVMLQPQSADLGLDSSLINISKAQANHRLALYLLFLIRSMRVTTHPLTSEEFCTMERFMNSAVNMGAKLLSHNSMCPNQMETSETPN